MTAKLAPRQAANPLALPWPPLLPPAARSRTAAGLAAVAAEGRFALQVCDACGRVQYPPREACVDCLGAALSWRDVPAGGMLIAETTLHASADPYFRVRMPWRIGTVVLECGPVAIAHLHGDVARGSRVRMTLRLDKSGQGVMLAMPAKDTPHMQDDRQLREMTCDPRDRRVLVTDGRGAFGQAIARACVDAGAATVFVGIAEEWRPFSRPDGPGIEMVPLDTTDSESVQRLSASLGGRVEILVNTALHIRPGGRETITSAREEMETAYFGLQRLAQTFGPALRARGGDGKHAACALVNIVSARALVGAPAQAAVLALSQRLRGELRPLRVINALVGPLDDEWHHAVSPPKVAPSALAAAIVRALREGIEDLAVGDVAQDLLTRWRDGPAALARESAAG